MKNEIHKYSVILVSMVSILAVSNNSANSSDTKKVREIRQVVIDAGFGGDDLGGYGCKKGVYSKDINLQIAKKLSDKIQKEFHFEVIMTRQKDMTLSLEKRTHIANSNNGDLFISIHTNAAEDYQIYGIETFYLGISNPGSKSENKKTNQKSQTEKEKNLDTIFTSLLVDTDINESKQLAADIQEALCGHLIKKYEHIKNRGIKKAPFYVLLGTKMPAVIIQTSFITNPRECARLTSLKYQDDLCDGIIKGIRQYIGNIKKRTK